MISTVLAAYLALILPQEAAAEWLPRPSDEQLLAAVQVEAPGAHILSSDFRDTPRGGARVGCGLFEANGQVEPFQVFTSWREALPERTSPISILVRAEDGTMQPVPKDPLQAEAAHWRTRVNAPVLADTDGDGIDRHDRNNAIYERKAALISCKSLTAPEGVTWVTELEPDPDPARQRRNEEQARALTDAIFGSGR